MDAILSSAPYRVTVPEEFDVESVVVVRRNGKEVRYSPREVYLQYHRRGWDNAKVAWITGRDHHNRLVGIGGPANSALRDGRDQFEHEVSSR